MENDKLCHCSTAGPVQVDLVLQSGHSYFDGFGEKTCDIPHLPLRVGLGQRGGAGHPFADLSASLVPVLTPLPPQGPWVASSLRMSIMSLASKAASAVQQAPLLLSLGDLANALCNPFCFPEA